MNIYFLYVVQSKWMLFLKYTTFNGILIKIHHASRNLITTLNWDSWNKKFMLITCYKVIFPLVLFTFFNLLGKC